MRTFLDIHENEDLNRLASDVVSRTYLTMRSRDERANVYKFEIMLRR